MDLRSRLPRLVRRAPRIAVLRLQGPIATAGRLGSSISDESLGPAIEAAFASRPAAVALAVNSPGGSPVQSALIAGRIRRLADEARIPVFAFCEDVAASGGYWLACAADEIWADRSSILGSIGVIYASFGFQNAIDKLGVERRVHTAGERKLMLDPFRPENPEDVERLMRLQSDIHDHFVAHVRARRGDRLAPQDLFTGEVWAGARAVELGLADGLGHLKAVMQGKYGAKARFREYTPRRRLSQRLGLSSAEGLAADAVAAVEVRLMWSRFGV